MNRQTVYEWTACKKRSLQSFDYTAHTRRHIHLKCNEVIQVATRWKIDRKIINFIIKTITQGAFVNDDANMSGM